MTRLDHPPITAGTFPDPAALVAVQEADIAGSFDLTLHEQRVRREPLDQQAFFVGDARGFDLDVVRPQRLANVGRRRPNSNGFGRGDTRRRVRAAVMRLQRHFVQRHAWELEV